MSSGSAEAWAHSRAGFRVSNCESGDRRASDVDSRYNGNAHLMDRGYEGKWQFLGSTYHSVGGQGNAADASEATQDFYAYKLFQRDGWGPWECAGIMGVR